MKRAAANSLIALCVMFAVSNPTANAVPMTSYYQQRMYIQQSSVLNDITEALGVSYIASAHMHAITVIPCLC